MSVNEIKTPGTPARRPASFYISPEMKKELVRLAKDEGRSVSSYICMLIKNAAKAQKKTG